MTTPLAIDCQHLTHRYGQFTAVDDLSLQVRCGETVGLLGPNGAGKTTVVRVLTTLTPVQSGEVYIFGLDSRRHTMDIRHNIGYVPQQLSIEAALTGRQNVELFARLYDVPRAAALRSGRRSAGCDAAARRRRRAGGHLLRRHGPPPRVGAGAGQPAVAADPRRADRRSGSHCARQCLGSGGAHAARVRHDGTAHHPLHAGGRRVVRSGGADAPRPAAGGRLAGGTQTKCRLRHMSPPARLRQRHSRTSSGTTRARISARTPRRPGSVRSGTAEGRRAVSVEQNGGRRDRPRAARVAPHPWNGHARWALSRSWNCRSCATTTPSCSPGWCSPRCGC